MKYLFFFCVIGMCMPVIATPTQNTNTKEIVSTIIEKANATVRVAPSGKARIKILAKGKNSFIGELWLAANAKVPLHRDSTEEYLHIVSGSGKMTIDGKTTEVSAGTTIFMPANAEVRFQNGPQPLRCLQVFSGPESAKKYLKWPIAKQ